MKLTKLLVIGLLAVPILTVSCGEDYQAVSDHISITAEDFKFGPAEWRVPVGEFEVEFMNHGNIEHEWAVLVKGARISTEDEFEEELVLFEVEKQPPGAMITETFEITEPGEYQVICALDGHFNAGMQGTLIVS